MFLYYSASFVCSAGEEKEEVTHQCHRLSSPTENQVLILFNMLPQETADMKLNSLSTVTLFSYQNKNSPSICSRDFAKILSLSSAEQNAN